MEVTRVVILAVHPEDLLQSTHLLLLDLPARVVLLLLIKVYNKAVTRIQVPTKTILKISTFDLREIHCPNRESSINLIHLGRIIHLMYQMLTEDILEETCHQTTPVVRIYTIDIAVVNSLQTTQREHHLMQEVIVIHLRRNHIRLLYRNKQLPVNLLRLPSLLLLHPILALKITTGRNRVDMELPRGHRYIQVVRVRIKICHRHHQVQTRLGATLTLPKTNSILSIINNDQRIQDGQIQPTSTIAVVGTIGFNIHLSNRSRKRRNSSNSHSNKRHQLVLFPLHLRQEELLVVNSGLINSQIEPHLSQL